jgi:glycine cleavage system aminomethyltransferase T
MNNNHSSEVSTEGLLISIGPRARKSPFFNATLRSGARAFTVYNHMYMPTHYGDPVAEYWSLVKDVTLWDVSCQRQIVIQGPDATTLMELMTPRDLSDCPSQRCLYVILTDPHGGIVNDAVLMRMRESEYWLSPGDGDVLLWAQGLAARSGMDVRVREGDIYPLQLQGPRSPNVAYKLFGRPALELGYYHVMQTELNGMPLVLSRTGWSGELGYEIYLADASRGDELWNAVMQAGAEFNIAPAAPNTIRSIEGGLLSYVSDIRREDNPYTFGLDRLVDLDKAAEFIGREALKRIRREGNFRRLAGIEIEGDPVGFNESFWPVFENGRRAGHVSRCAWSPRLERNIGWANLPAAVAATGTRLTVSAPGATRAAVVVDAPWFPAEKIIPPGIGKN